MNSTQDSTRVKSLLQLVSKIAFTPKDLKNLVSFLKACNGKSLTFSQGKQEEIWIFLPKYKESLSATGTNGMFGWMEGK